MFGGIIEYSGMLVIGGDYVDLRTVMTCDQKVCVVDETPSKENNIITIINVSRNLYACELGLVIRVTEAG